VRRAPWNLQLTEQQLLIVGLILAILVASSVLYCLGIASVALRDTLSGTPLPLDATFLPLQDLELTPGAPLSVPTPTPPA
jgi:hypothetical protein